MGGAEDFKVGGTKQDSQAERAENFFVPPLSQMYKQSRHIKELMKKKQESN